MKVGKSTTGEEVDAYPVLGFFMVSQETQSISFYMLSDHIPISSLYRDLKHLSLGLCFRRTTNHEKPELVDVAHGFIE